MSWHDKTHDEYNEKQWDAVKAHLDGTVLDEVKKHLVRKRQGEADAEYDARKDIADYIPHYARAALSLAGMLMAQEDEAQRTWWDDPVGGESDEPPADAGNVCGVRVVQVEAE